MHTNDKFNVINEEDPLNVTKQNLLGTENGHKKTQLLKYPLRKKQN